MIWRCFLFGVILYFLLYVVIKGVTMAYKGRERL